MRLHLFGGTQGAAEYGIGAEIDPLDAIGDGYRVWIDSDGWWRGDPLQRCRWSSWWGKPVLARPDWSEVADFRLTKPSPNDVIQTNPDCVAGKHDACNGDGWDTRSETVCACPCNCHPPKEDDRG